MKKCLSLLVSLILMVTMVTPSALASDVIEINLITCFPEAATDTSAIAFHQVYEGFSQKYPNIHINHEMVDPSTYPFKMQTLAMADEMPDVFLLEGASTQIFADLGVIAPINDILDADPAYRDQFLDGVFADVSLGDDIYAVPYQNTSCTLLFYNEKLLNEVGITELPTDWPAFMEAVRTLKAAGKIPIALGNKEQWPAVSPLFSTLADRVTGSDFPNKVKKGEAKFTDEIFLKALDLIVELRDAGAFNEDMNTIDSEQGRALFAQGDCGFMFEGGWAVSSIEMAVSDELRPYIKVMDTPVVPGGLGSPMSYAGGGGFGYTINPKLEGEKREAAIAVMKYFTTGDYVDRLYEVGGAPAAKIHNADASKLSPLTVLVNDYCAQSTILPVYDVVFPSQIYMMFYMGIQEILAGTGTPQSVAESAQAEADLYIQDIQG